MPVLTMLSSSFRTMSKAATGAKQLDFSVKWSYADVTFVVEGKRLWANRAVLAMWSPVFEAMFASDFKERNLAEIELPGKKYDNIQELLSVTHPPNKEITGIFLCHGRG
jgi:BTB/POZ domain